MRFNNKKGGIMDGECRVSVGYMVFASILAIVLGFVMLVYPGGTMALITTAFWMLQAIISFYIILYAVTEAARSFRANRKRYGFAYILCGLVAAVLVWVFNVSIVYIFIAAFFVLTGIGEILGARYFSAGKYFVAFLGFLNIVIGALILKNPVILPLLIAWYVLFWGISRLFLALEIRRIAS